MNMNLRENEWINLRIQFFVFLLRNLKIKIDEFRVKFVEICKRFNECDKIKKFNKLKYKISFLPL